MEDWSVRKHEQMMMDQLRKELTQHQATVASSEEQIVEGADAIQDLKRRKEEAMKKVGEIEKKLMELQRHQFMP
jgi:chromosome segregation ATPase